MALKGEGPTMEGLDFRAPMDDVWYAVRLRMEEGALHIMYYSFLDGYDELYQVDGFRNVEELEEFRGQFWSTSVQLQDNECRKVIEGI